MIKKMCFVILVGLASTVQAVEINQKVANAYNVGVVRCSNAECARYLYACFRTYSSSSLQEFLACGTQASRLNDNQRVVKAPQRG